MTQPGEPIGVQEVLGEFGALDLLDTVGRNWQRSLASFPDGLPDFINPESIRTSLRWCGFEAELDTTILAAAGRIAANPSLVYLAWHYYRVMYDYATDAPVRFVPLERALRDDAGTFYLLIALAVAPRMIALHRRLGIPEEVTRDTCKQVRCICDCHRRAHGGRLGVFPQQARWLRHYVDGTPYFRLGRLEYWARPFNHDYEVYRHRRDGRTIVLAGPGWKINPAGWNDGWFDAASGNQSGRQTTLKRAGSCTHGFPINPRGFVEHDPVSLPETEWECVLEKGVPVLDLHIPAGGGMTLDRCLDSFRRAARFFAGFCPSPARRAIVCSSWIFSPVLEEILPADSNLTRFMREVYLLCPSRAEAAPWFVFPQDRFDPATAPRETSLQRAILRYLEAGNTWDDGAMVFLLDDLDRFGSQWYRKNYATNTSTE